MNMMSHLFRGHAIAPMSQRTIDAYVDELAEWLAKDRYSLPEIARRMDVTGGTVTVLLRHLCEKMGEPVIA